MSIPRDYLPLTFTDSWVLLNAYIVTIEVFKLRRIPVELLEQPEP